MNTASRHLPAIVTLAIVVSFVGLWQLYTTVGGVSPFILPQPGAVLNALIRLLSRASTYRDLLVTLIEAVGGFLLATICGVALGVLLGKMVWLERALQPILVAVQVTPKVVLVPLFIVWFGFGVGSKIVIAAVLAFLPIMSNTLLGVRSIEAGHQDVMASLDADRIAKFRWLELPSAMPYVLTGMEIGIVLAMIGAIVGEFLGGNEGLGHLAVGQLNAFEVAALFANILLLAVAGALLYLIVVMLRKLLAPWHAASTRGML
jgi:NitT/TauT family transport system permease protein